MQKILFSLKMLFYGFKYVLKNSWTWKYIFIAICINSVLLVCLILVFSLLTNYLLNFLLTFFPYDLNSVVETSLNIIALILGFIVSIFVFIFTANIANSPVYGRLAEIYLEKNSKETFMQRSFSQEIFYTLGFELKKLFVLVLLLILTLLVNLIPFIGQILFVILSALQIILYAGFDFFDAYLSRKGFRFRSKAKYVLSNPLKHFPFLGISGLLVSIPGVNVIIWPFLILSGLQLTLENETIN